MQEKGLIIESKNRATIKEKILDYLEKLDTWSDSDILRQEFYVEISPAVLKKTYDQIKCFKGMTNLVYETDIISHIAGHLEGVRDYYKEAVGFIDGYVYDIKFYDKNNNAKTTEYFSKDKGIVPNSAINIKAKTKSCAVASRKILAEMINLVLNDLDKLALENDGFTERQLEEYLRIRNNMEEKSLNKLRDREEKRRNEKISTR